MTVKEMIEKLKEFPEDMEVVDDLYMDIEDIYIQILGKILTTHMMNQINKWQLFINKINI